MEIWKDIIDYEGLYQVSNLGRMKRLKKISVMPKGGVRIHEENITSGHIIKSGYKNIMLYKNGIGKNKQIHRLVLETFKSNINNKPCVNHINGDKTNNNLWNLEWATYSENTIHSIYILNSNRKHIEIRLLNIYSNEIKLFNSKIDVCKYFKKSRTWFATKCIQQNNKFNYKGWVII